MSLADRCRVIAEIAHVAAGQVRADGVTPAIVHLQQTAAYVTDWYGSGVYDDPLETLQAAAYLHDIIEDTDVGIFWLERWEVPERVQQLVLLLTKLGNKSEPERATYYRTIGTDAGARLIKAADICSNIEDAATFVRNGGKTRRWTRFLERILAHARPIYTDEPHLLAEITKRASTLLDAIREAENTDRAAWAAENVGSAGERA